MIFKFVILLSIVKIGFSLIEDIKITSSNVDTQTELHVIATVFNLFENHYDFKTFTKALVDNMDTKYGKSWISHISANNSGEIYVGQQSSSYISITYKEFHVTLFKAKFDNEMNNTTLVKYLILCVLFLKDIPLNSFLVNNQK